MRITFLFLFVLLFSLKPKAQDKLFFIDGKTKKGMIVSNTKDHLYFKETDTSKTERIDKSSLILVEDYKRTSKGKNF
jgi:hypothetical protein